MPYDLKIEEKIDKEIERWGFIDKRKMFGGLCYMVSGNMCFGIYKDYLIVRTGQEEAEKRLKLKNTRPFDITGSAMRGWVMVEKPGYSKPDKMLEWLGLGRDFAKSLPKKY